jgi:hypothetical protein
MSAEGFELPIGRGAQAAQAKEALHACSQKIHRNVLFLTRWRGWWIQAGFF